MEEFFDMCLGIAIAIIVIVSFNKLFPKSIENDTFLKSVEICNNFNGLDKIDINKNAYCNNGLKFNILSLNNDKHK